MSKGKYSPALTREDCARPYTEYKYNADKQIPPEWTLEMKESGLTYCDRTYGGWYDENGYDSYGYSAFLADGTYVGGGNGVDRWGYTEMDYLTMDDEEFEDICRYGG